MTAVPVRTPVVKTEHKGSKVHVTVMFERPRWQRFLGAHPQCQRTFALDAYGQEVYGFCDGNKSVKTCIELFSKSHHLSLAEAEIAVSTFLKTLMAKGLVVMVMKQGNPSQ